MHLEIPVMIRALALPKGLRMLEVGCGRGIALPVLSSRLAPSRIVGVDLDSGALAEAKQHLRDCATPGDLAMADVRHLPFQDKSFDLVIDFGTCFHIARASEALREIARVLVSGGLFVTETVVSQLLSHPVRTRGRPLPWNLVPALVPWRHAGLWESRRRVPP